MDSPSVGGRPYPLRMLPKDVGVALVVLVALALGGLLRYQTDSAATAFREQDGPLRLAYPRAWGGVESPPGMLLRVEDPRTMSAFKTSIAVERRELDPASLPTVQTLVDRRVAGYEALTAFRLLAHGETTVAGARAARLDYAYVAQPIEIPGSVAPPVVVRAREYIVVAQDRTYYFTLAAPEDEYADALARFDRMIKGVQIQ